MPLDVWSPKHRGDSNGLRETDQHSGITAPEELNRKGH